MLQPVLDRIDADFKAATKRLFDLLRIPSISTDPAFRDQVQQAARFVADDLKTLGFKTTVHATAGHPIVTATRAADRPGAGAGPGAPRVLYYGHYDVQPPDPLELWTSPPFEPALVDGPRGKRIVARGAVDDKGQLMTFIEAMRAWLAVHGALPVGVTILLEGEEESGSPSLDPFLESHRADLAADVAVICDTGMWDIDTPAITYMLRGLVYAEVTLQGPSHDLHSGMFGGAVVNPAYELCRILGGLKDERGVVQIPRFYDDVRELTPEEAAQWKSLGFDEKKFLAGAGLKTPSGEAGRTALERIWARPTCEINGLWAGYTGEGAKTVIGSKASAKVSCRLVPDQDPTRIWDGLVRYFEERTPPDCRWTFTAHGRSPAVRVPTESPWLEAARKGLERTFGRPAVLIGCGGSIPVVGSIRRILGYDSLLVGFGLDDDRIHSPNEKFELTCFERGIKAHAAILEELSKAGGAKPRRGKTAATSRR